jgi:PEP-CTERM motif-containing protein
MRWGAAGLMVSIGLFLSGVAARPVAAGLVDFDLSNCALASLPVTCNNSDSGHPVLDFLSGGLDLGVSGFVGGSPNNFDLVVASPDETGLGLFGQPHNEVNLGDSEVFDFGKLAALGITSGTMTVSSLQAGEVGILTDQTGPHAVAEVDGTGIGTVPFSFSLANPIVTLTANSGDVLAAADVEVSVPEPASLILAGTAVLGLLWYGRRRRRWLDPAS